MIHHKWSGEMNKAAESKPEAGVILNNGGHWESFPADKKNTMKQSNLLTRQLVTPSGHRELGQTEGKVSTVVMSHSWNLGLLNLLSKRM